MPEDFKRRDRARERLSPGSYRAVLDHERYYSLFAVAAVKIMLLVFLLAFFGLMLKLMRTSFSNIGATYRFSLPAMIVVIAVILAADIRKNIKGIITLRRGLRERSK
jgi:hypothetical protein